MDTAADSSQDKLDGMLRAGTISEEDYVVLSRAMARPPAASQPVGEKAVAGERAALRKSWDGGVLGGLCAGYARYFGVDPFVIRSVPVVLFALLIGFGGAGIVVVAVYFGLCCLLPWDEPEKAKAFVREGRPRRFLLAVIALYLVLPWLYSVLAWPWLLSIYEHMGANFFGGHSLRAYAVNCVSEYHGILQNAPALVLLALGAVISVAVFFVYVARYCLCRATVRRYYTVATLGLGTLWLLFMVFGSLEPIVTMWGALPR